MAHVPDKHYHYRLKHMKKYIKKFKLSHKIFNNLEKYENATYLDNKNSALYGLILRGDESSVKF